MSAETDEPGRHTVLFGALGAGLALAIGAAFVLPGGSGDDRLATDPMPGVTTTIAETPAFREVAASPVSTIPTTTAAPTTTTSTTTSTSTTTTTTTTLPKQETTPIAPPPDPRGYEEQVQLGSIAIPKIGLDATMLEGIRLTTLDLGPGHWPGTAMPGQIGNVVVAAHRTSHNAEFRNIDQLVPGDVVTFTTADGTFDYVVTGTEIVNPDAIWIVDPTDTPTATLFACHPPGSVRQRIVVYLALAT